jgi:anaphase-promoting complex subunit 8
MTEVNRSLNSSNMSISVATTQKDRSMFLSPTSLGSLGSPSVAGMSSPKADLNWDAQAIRSELHTASIALSQRCLKLAAKWATEQLLGLPSYYNNAQQQSQQQQSQKTDDTNDNSSNDNSALDLQSPFIKAALQEMDPFVLHAKSLVEMGEYMHAAAMLSRPNQIVTTMAAPLPNLSSYGIFLRAYALFMAGERRKEEDYIELQR